MKNNQWGRMLLFLLACMMQVMTVQAQTAFTDNFNAEAKESKVYLRWTMKSGKTCEGITIARSIDGANYTDINIISGVCGSEDSAQVFQYTDLKAEAGKTNFYRLTFGTTGQTVAQPVFVLADNGFALYPNPARSSSRLYFGNRDATEAVLKLCNMEGRMVILAKTTTSMFNIDCSYLPAGIYLFQLIMPNNSINGKLTVIH